MKNESSALYIAVTVSNLGGGIGLVAYDRSGELIDIQGMSLPDHAISAELELIALAESLQYACDGDIIYTRSEFCVRGFNEWLDNWKQKGWRKADKKPVAYRQLWQQIDSLRAGKFVEVKRGRAEDHAAFCQAQKKAMSEQTVVDRSYL